MQFCETMSGGAELDLNQFYNNVFKTFTENV